jgi:hypothetical protein
MTASPDHRDWAPAVAEGDRGEWYEIRGGDDFYEAWVTLVDGTITKLPQPRGHSHPAAYSACVRHYYGPLESLF